MRMIRGALGVFFIMAVVFCGIMSNADAEEHLLNLPSSLTVIKTEAFYKDWFIKKVIIPNGVTRIESKAFAESSVQEIVLPGHLGEGDIAEDAFLNSLLHTVYTIRNSKAWAWAVKNKYDVKERSEFYRDPYASWTKTYYNSPNIPDELSDMVKKETFYLPIKAEIQISADGSVATSIDGTAAAASSPEVKIPYKGILNAGYHTLLITGVDGYWVSISARYLPAIVCDASIVAPGTTTKLKVVPGTPKVTDWTIVGSSDRSDNLTVSKDGKITALQPGIEWVRCKADGKTLRKEIKIGYLVPNKMPVDIGGTTEINVYPPDEKVTPRDCLWKSSDSSVFTVDRNGVLTGVGCGEATLHCTLPNGGGVLTGSVIVQPGLNKSEMELFTGMSSTLSVTGYDLPVTWISSDSTVATVDENGKVEGVSSGTAVVSCIIGEGTASCTVTVYNMPEIRIVEQNRVLQSGDIIIHDYSLKENWQDENKEMTIVVSNPDNCPLGCSLDNSWSVAITQPDPAKSEYKLRFPDSREDGLSILTFSGGNLSVTFAEIWVAVGYFTPPGLERGYYEIPTGYDIDYSLLIPKNHDIAVTWDVSDPEILSVESVENGSFQSSRFDEEGYGSVATILVTGGSSSGSVLNRTAYVYAQIGNIIWYPGMPISPSY